MNLSLLALQTVRAWRRITMTVTLLLLALFCTNVNADRCHHSRHTQLLWLYLCDALGGIIFSNTAGLTTADLDTFEYTRRVPLYPFETDLVYKIEEEAEAFAEARL